ncbi:hypothetical protein PoB_001196300 [Plakobranchus ocellatus]|uniref:Uncharacterized protein n=1 Tax=Plakobranchus ocellatus TaxID=259542 RepID=A0AAV3YSC0_9GAST|nr:hypothetical protein PoB_001196300 [Plakobranchus ocellatus]
MIQKALNRSEYFPLGAAWCRHIRDNGCIIAHLGIARCSPAETLLLQIRVLQREPLPERGPESLRLCSGQAALQVLSCASNFNSGKLVELVAKEL